MSICQIYISGFIIFLFVVVGTGCQKLDVLISPSRSVSVVERRRSGVIEKMSALATRWDDRHAPFGLDRQVFYDDAVIGTKDKSISRYSGRTKKINNSEPVITQDQGWESKYGKWGVGLYFSVLTNEVGLFKCWYQYGRNDEVGYAESKDGIHWDKPRLGLTRDNCVMFPAHGPCVMIDEHEERKNHRYKMIYGTRGQYNTQKHGDIFFAHSSDGIRWTTYSETTPLTSCRTDTGNSMMWDEEMGLYRVYVRPDTGKLRRSRQYVREFIDEGATPFMKEMFFLSGNVDPWLQVCEWTVPDEYGQTYSFFCQKYGSLYLGYVNLFVSGGDKTSRYEDLHRRCNKDINEFFFVTSRDGLEWDVSSLEANFPLVDRGPLGTFDQNSVWPPSSPLITVGDCHWIYYMGQWARHSSFIPIPKDSDLPPRRAIGLAIIRMDGLAYLENTSEDDGFVETKTFVLAGDELEVNVDANGGEDDVLQNALAQLGEPHTQKEGLTSSPENCALRIEVVGQNGNPYQGYGAENCDAITSDGAHVTVSWNGSPDMSPLRNKEVKLRFLMEGRVRLYAFQVKAGGIRSGESVGTSVPGGAQVVEEEDVEDRVGMPIDLRL